MPPSEQRTDVSALELCLVSVPHAPYQPLISTLRANIASLAAIRPEHQERLARKLWTNSEQISVADATHERVVKREDGERLAKEFGVPFMETSARSGLNVELAFTAVAKELKHRSMKDPSEKFKLQE
ncbi:Ras-related protein Rab-26, partial [Nibea albiflora]